MITGRSSGISFSDDCSDEGLSYDVSVALSFGQSFELRAEHEAIDVSDGAFDVLSLGGVLKF